MIPKNADKWIVGAALAFAASTLLPIAKETFRPLLADGAEAGGALLKRARSWAQLAREEVEDIVAEAQFERMKKQLDQDIATMENDVKE